MTNPIQFRYSNYNYRVRLGKVMNRDEITWKHTFFCREWKDVNLLMEMWGEKTDNQGCAKVSVSYKEVEK